MRKLKILQSSSDKHTYTIKYMFVKIIPFVLKYDNVERFVLVAYIYEVCGLIFSVPIYD
jgi:hypothetical protein